MTSSDDIKRPWPYEKALSDYNGYFVNFAADSVSKHAMRALPDDMVATMKEAKPFGASDGPNCVDMFEAEFVSAANKVGRKMVMEMQQQEKDAAARGTALPAEHAAIVSLASKAVEGEAVVAYQR